MIGSLALSSVLIFAAVAQESAESGPSRGLPQRDASAAFEAFRSEFSPLLRATWNFDTGVPHHIFGVAVNVDPVPVSDADHERAARALVDRFPGMFGFNSEALELRWVKHLDLAALGTTDKLGVVFDQVVEGVRVEAGSLSFIFDDRGRLLSIAHQGLPGVQALNLIPSLSESAALAQARVAFEQPVLELRAVPELVIVTDTSETAPALAWNVELRSTETRDDLPIQELLSIDAQTGALIRKVSTVHTFTDLIGHTEAWATPGLYPDTSSNPETVFNLHWALMSSPVGNGQTDVNGDWAIGYAGSNPQDVTAAFGSGSRYAYVLNEQGSELSLTKTVTPGTSESFRMNKGRTEFGTAQVNAQVHVVRFREWIRTLDPTDNLMDFRVRANVNLNSSCNAYYDGSSINFYNAAGGCPNTAFSTVVAHEEGHWANSIYGSGNGGDGFGEGASDIWAMYIYDDPVVGRDFCGPGCNVRTGNNSRQYCGSCGAGCYGGVHANGEVLMGAFWKARRNLNNTLGDSMGDLVADSLFLAWMQVYNDSTICTSNRDHLLVLDDDDGNLANGTPHGCDIDAGFVEQGFPAFYDSNSVAVDVTPLAEIQPAHSTIEVRAQAFPGVCGGGGSVTGLDLFYSVNGGDFVSLAMHPTAQPDEWLGVIPALESPSAVHYYVLGTSSTGATGTAPDDAPLDDRFVFYVGAVENLAFYDFEASGDQGWTHQQIQTQDDWQRGRPRGKSTDPASAFSGTRVWANDIGGDGWNGEYQPDVSNVLYSPTFDFSGKTGVHVQFRRWLGIQDRDFDKARFKLNGRALFRNPDDRDVIDDHWTLQEFDASAFADNVNAVEFSFELLSNASVQYGGWNIDDFRVLALTETDSDCASPSNYGSGTAGSGGITPTIYSTGGPPNTGNPAFTVVGEQMLGSTLAFLIAGSGRGSTSFSGVELLVNLTGSLWIPVFVSGPPTAGLGRVEIPIGIPEDPALHGGPFNLQFLVVDPGGPQGYAATSGLEGVICDG